MGGFMINGTGTSDKLISIKNLGIHHCPRCNSMQEFDLTEVKRRIKVLYIPTVTTSVKYAVTCTRCKKGVYIEDDIRDGLLYDRLALEINDGKVQFRKLNSTTQEEPAKVEEKTQEDVVKYCSQCGTKIEVGQNFCRECGAKLED